MGHAAVGDDVGEFVVLPFADFFGFDPCLGGGGLLVFLLPKYEEWAVGG